jgi:hypothetical protein
VRAVVWDEYGFTYLFDSDDEARAWVAGLMAVDDDLELVCRVHEYDYVPERGDELCNLCVAECRPQHLTHLSAEAWCFMPPGERFPD